MSSLFRQRQQPRQPHEAAAEALLDEASSSGSSRTGSDVDDDDDASSDGGKVAAAPAGRGRSQNEGSDDLAGKERSSSDDDDDDDGSSSDGSSGSDDDDDDGSDDEAGREQARVEHLGKAKARRDEYYDDDGDDDAGNAGNDAKRRGDGDIDHDSASSDRDVPLHERVRRWEERGASSTLKSGREKKLGALRVAGERLAALKRLGTGHGDGGGRKRKATDEGPATEAGPSRADPSDRSNPNTTSGKNKKKGKHRPTEVSSRRADYFRRGAPKLNESGVGVEIGAHRYKPVDPRGSNLAGHFDEERFQRDYAFLEEMRNQEIGQVRKRIAARGATGDRGRRLRRKLGIAADGNGGSAGGASLEDDEARLKALTQDRAALERSKVERTAKQTVKRKIQDEVASGKRGAYFLKRKELKRLEMEAKLEEIRKRSGNKAVEKMLERKRRKNKSRDAGMFAK